MSYFKRLAQLIWVGSSIGGVAGTPNFVRGVGKGEKSVSLVDMGWGFENSKSSENRICAKLSESGRLAGVGWKGTNGGWWWNHKEGGKIDNKKEDEEFEKCGKTVQGKGQGIRSEGRKNGMDKPVERANKKLLECLGKKGEKKDLLICLQQERDKLIKQLEEAEKGKQNKVKREWDEIRRENWFPFKEIFKKGEGWTWHKR